MVKTTLALVEITSLPKAGKLGIWKIEESDDFFGSRMKWSQAEKQQLAGIRGRRKTEWLASRWLLHLLSNRTERGPVIKDQYGKPHLSGSTWQISISHTHGYTAVIAAPFLVGIDIQTRVEKIYRITHKFLSDDEQSQIPPDQQLEYLHIYWGAKECLYKAYGRRSLDLRRDLAIEPFMLGQNQTHGNIIKKEGHAFDIHFRVVPEYIMVYALQTSAST